MNWSESDKFSLLDLLSSVCILQDVLKKEGRNRLLSHSIPPLEGKDVCSLADHTCNISLTLTFHLSHFVTLQLPTFKGCDRLMLMKRLVAFFSHFPVK